MLFSELYKTVVKTVSFEGFKGEIAPLDPPLLFKNYFLQQLNEVLAIQMLYSCCCDVCYVDNPKIFLQGLPLMKPFKTQSTNSAHTANSAQRRLFLTVINYQPRPRGLHLSTSLYSCQFQH